MTNFKDLNLNENILKALESKGYNDPTPIQLQAIPHVLEGRDLFGIAQTGTGKTAAFSLPILHNLAKNKIVPKSGGVRVLILTPTRELASQIADNIELYGKELGLRYTVVFGGVNERPQIAAIQRGVDILIATPGRLLDLSNQGHIRYMQLEVLVLDEADRMLDMGFINDIKKIIAKIPPKRQTLFFSATMPNTIVGLANSILKDPIKIEVTPASSTVEKIDQRVFLVDKSHKLSLLKKVLKNDATSSALVFCKTKHGANKVVEFLEKNSVLVAAIHGNKSQAAREKALAAFRAGTIKVLVATDIAARGIDIPAISHVINYDIPLDPESYVHRIGRTARAGREGSAISFCDPSETKFLREVEKVIKIKIPVDETHPFHGVEAAPMQARQSHEPRFEQRSNSSRSAGGRKYGFAVNKERKISEFNSKKRSEVEGGERGAGNRGDVRHKDFSNKERSKDNKKFLGIFNFGKNKLDKKEDKNFRDDSKSRNGSDSRFKEEGVKKESFGFPWFGKNKSDKGSKKGFGSNNRRNENVSGGKKKPYYSDRNPNFKKPRNSDN